MRQGGDCRAWLRGLCHRCLSSCVAAQQRGSACGEGEEKKAHVEAILGHFDKDKDVRHSMLMCIYHITYMAYIYVVTYLRYVYIYVCIHRGGGPAVLAHFDKDKDVR